MTARTHDLFAFTGITLAVIYLHIPQMSLATALVSFAMVFLGGLTPDIDEPTSAIWQRMPAGSGGTIGRMMRPAFGAHRYITHSLLGLFLFGKLAWFLMMKIAPIFLVDMNVVWSAFMIGFSSHLIADSFTKEGVPYLFPIQWKFGFPPFKRLRIITGDFTEKAIVFPGLLFINGYLIYKNYGMFLSLVKSLVS